MPPPSSRPSELKGPAKIHFLPKNVLLLLKYRVFFCSICSNPPTHTHINTHTHKVQERSTNKPLSFAGPLSKDQLISSRTEANAHWKQTHLFEMPVSCLPNKPETESKQTGIKEKFRSVWVSERARKQAPLKLNTRPSSDSPVFLSDLLFLC